MSKFKNICAKIASVLEYVIGLALIVCLFVGGLGFFGYMAAFCIGGETAAEICNWLNKTFYVILIKVATVTTLVTFLMLYFRGDAKWVNPLMVFRKKSEPEKTEGSEQR